MPKILTALILSVTLASCTLTAALPYVAGAVATGVTLYVVDPLFEEETESPDIVVEEGGEVTVINEAEELPDSAISLVAFLISHIWETLAAVLVLWLMPSPAQIRKHFKAWREKAEGLKDKIL
jgi:hypothetical protein